MAHPGPDTRPQYGRGLHPARVSDAGRRIGWALLGAALPAIVAIVGVALVEGSVAGGLFQWLETAMETNVIAGSGLQWAIHVAALTGLVGLWALGLALVVEGFFGVE